MAKDGQFLENKMEDKDARENPYRELYEKNYGKDPAIDYLTERLKTASPEEAPLLSAALALHIIGTAFSSLHNPSFGE